MEKINIEEFSPFLTILIAEATANVDLQLVHKEIVKVLDIPEATESQTNIITSSIDDDIFSEITGGFYSQYVVDREVSWTSSSGIKNKEYHACISIQHGTHYAFWFSETGKKEEVRKLFRHQGYLKSIKQIPMGRLFCHFLDPEEIKTIWLSDVSGSSGFKAENKVLGGTGVADYLDPLLDQSYMMSAIRTLESFSNGQASVGVNPFKSSIWRSNCHNWENFRDRVIEILDRLNSNASETPQPLKILAYPINDITGLSDPYDFSVIAPDFLIDENPSIVKLVTEIEKDYEIATETCATPNHIGLEIKYKGIQCGRVKVAVELNDFDLILRIIDEDPVKGMRNEFGRFRSLLKKPRLIKCWFESGHALVCEKVFKSEFRDVDFPISIWENFEDIDIGKEKPTRRVKSGEDVEDLSQIGLQDSLFCWVKKYWNGCWNKPEDYTLSTECKGWLYCDDGAGEISDFIHLVEFDGTINLSLIHVKASKSRSPNRRVSVGAHDVVLNQAVKNIRHCDRHNLIDSLEERLNGKERTGKRCWKDGKEIDYKQFVKEVALLRNRKLNSRVIVVQPHTRKSYYEDSNKQDDNIMRQLKTLFVSTENAVRSTSSSFYVVASDE